MKTWVFTSGPDVRELIYVQATPISSSVRRVEWCQECGALRFQVGERFVAPKKVDRRRTLR
jgi:hypothetical protein